MLYASYINGLKQITLTGDSVIRCGVKVLCKIVTIVATLLQACMGFMIYV